MGPSWDSGEETQVRVLLGARAGSKAAEDFIDVRVKRFLVKVWKKRRRVSLAINDRLGRQDVVWAKDWGWSKPQLTDKRATHRRKCRATYIQAGQAWTARRGRWAACTAARSLQPLTQLREPGGGSASLVIRTRFLYYI
jgi:hypothetical protein